ncbi:MAG: glyoxylase I family protein [Candidatus Azotimanducaceae bacterium]|jgi:glyoxylase I family protein
MEIKAHHTSFPVKDIVVSVAFYRDVLCLTEIPRPEIFKFPGAWFQAGACQVHLIQIIEGDDVGTPPMSINPRGRHSAFSVSDYEETLVYFKDKGIEVFETNVDMGQMWIKDPDGHVLEFIAISS